MRAKICKQTKRINKHSAKTYSHAYHVFICSPWAKTIPLTKAKWGIRKKKKKTMGAIPLSEMTLGVTFGVKQPHTHIYTHSLSQHFCNSA